MQSASGFQIAFLILAFQFFTMLVASWASTRLAWPAESFEFLGQLITFGSAALALAGIGPLRRFCIDELRRPLSGSALREMAAVAIAKPAIPFAVTGGVVLIAFATGEHSRILSALPSMDPAKAWAWTLSPAGLTRMLVLSWVVGPIIEELVFRGLLYQAWERQWGWLPSLVLTSACFSLFHPNFMVSAFLGSVVYICVLRRTGTLRASILVHMAFNVLVSWPLLGRFVVTAGSREASRLSGWMPELACLVLVAIALPAYLAMSRTDARAPADR